MKVEQYMKQFQEIAEKLNGRGKQSIALAIMQELAKDRRMAEIREARENNNGEATPNQKSYARDLGIEIPAGVTKAEASRMITKAVAMRNRAVKVPVRVP